MEPPASWGEMPWAEISQHLDRLLRESDERAAEAGAERPQAPEAAPVSGTSEAEGHGSGR